MIYFITQYLLLPFYFIYYHTLAIIFITLSIVPRNQLILLIHIKFVNFLSAHINYAKIYKFQTFDFEYIYANNWTGIKLVLSETNHTVEIFKL